MKLLHGIIPFLLATIALQAQTYEVGLLAGGVNGITDVGSENFIAPSDIGFGVIAKWNRSERHSFRASILFSEISGDDADSSDPSRVQRALNYRNSLLEFSLGMEYTFWEFSMYDGKFAHAPYLYTGLTYFQYDNLRLDRQGNIDDLDGKRWQFSVPMVLGYKFTLTRKLVLAAEIGARYTFTDNLDGSNPEGDLDDAPGLKFGNTNSNDWYVFTGISLTYTFGRQPCYCNF